MERDWRIVGSMALRCKISTHTLTWSVTREKIKKIAPVNNFNSHAHVERDAVYLYDE